MPLLLAGGREFSCDAVLFDKDGTLLDFKVMWLAWSEYMIDGIMAATGDGLVPRKALERAMGIDLAEWHVDPAGPLAGGTMSGLREALVETLGKAGMAEGRALELVQEVSRRSETAMDWESLARPVPGLRGLLARLRRNKYKLAVVTADTAERTKISMTALQLINYFDAVIGADLVAKSKPAPDMVHLACRLLGVKPDRAVVVGDTPRDIVMAKSAGSASIAVLSGVGVREQLSGADAVIESVGRLQVFYSAPRII